VTWPSGSPGAPVGDAARRPALPLAATRPRAAGFSGRDYSRSSPVYPREDVKDLNFRGRDDEKPARLLRWSVTRTTTTTTREDASFRLLPFKTGGPTCSRVSTSGRARSSWAATRTRDHDTHARAHRRTCPRPYGRCPLVTGLSVRRRFTKEPGPGPGCWCGGGELRGTTRSGLRPRRERSGGGATR